MLPLRPRRRVPSCVSNVPTDPEELLELVLRNEVLLPLLHLGRAILEDPPTLGDAFQEQRVPYLNHEEHF